MAEDCRTVLVKGLNKRTSTETLENYFSSSRRGGEISSIEHDQENGTAFITFASPEGVQKALKDAHTIDDKNLTLEVKSSESMEPNKIYVEGFGEKTTRDTLKYYIERIADTDVLDITFGPRCNAIITVEDTPAWGRHETVNDDEGNENSKTGNEDEPRGLEQNPPTELQRTVLVSDIPAEVTELEVLLYFQKKVNGGGEVANVKLFPEEQKALVVFQEVEVADTVIRKKHLLKGKPVGVEKYKPTPDKIEVGCIFIKVTAIVNHVLFQNMEPQACKDILDETQVVCGIQWHDAAYGILVTGALEQVKRAKEFLQEKFDVNCAEHQGRENDSFCTNKWEPAFRGLLNGQMMAEDVGREFTEDTVNVSKQSWPQDDRMQPTYQYERKEEAWPNQQGKGTEFGDLNSGATTKKWRHESEANTPPDERSQPYTPRGQEQSKKHTLWSPSSFIENNALPQQTKIDGGKSVDEKSNQDSESDFSHDQPSMYNQTGHQTTKPTPAPRSNREPSYQATQPTGHGNGGQTTGTPERRRIGALFHTERGSGKQKQSEPSTGHSPIPRRPNNIMDFGTETQTSPLKKQSSEENKKDQLENGNRSLQQGPEKDYGDDSGLLTDQEQVNLEESAPVEDKAQEREDGAKPSDQGGPDKSIDTVLSSLEQLNLDEDLSPTDVVQFIQTVYSQDLERFKSQNYVDIVLSKDKGPQLKPMRKFEDSEFEDVKKRFQRFYKMTAKDLKRETLDLSELSGQDIEKIKKSIMKQRERSDVMVEETSSDVFTLVGETGNVELFRKNVMGVLGSKDPPAESKPSDQGGPDKSIDTVLSSLEQLNLDEDLSPTDVVQFIQTVYSQDLERFKSQNYVDIVLSKDKGLQLKPMRKFEDSEFEDVKKRRVQKALKDAHTIDDKNLTLEVKSSESMEPNKIYVEGFGEKTTRDTLKYYIERIADTDVLDITFGPRCNAIITVEDTPDFAHLVERAKEKLLEGIRLTIRPVPVCRTIVISNLPQTASDEVVLLKFESPRSGGGEVGNVQLDKEKRTAIVQFKEHTVLESVLSRDHTMDGRKLTVERYDPLLGDVTDENKQAETRNADQTDCGSVNDRIEIAPLEIDTDLYKYLETNHPANWQQVLREAKATVEEKEGLMAITAESDRSQSIKDFLNGFKCERISFDTVVVDNGLREDMEKLLEIFKSNKAVSLQAYYSKGCIKIAGRYPSLKRAVDEVNSCVEAAKARHAKTMRQQYPIHLSSVYVKVLQHSGKYQASKEGWKREGIDVSLDTCKNQLMVKCSENQREKVSDDILKLVSCFGERELELKPSLLLATPLASNHVKALLRDKQLEIEFLIKDNQKIITLYGIEQAHVDEAHRLITSHVGEFNIPLGDTGRSLRHKETRDSFLNAIGKSTPLTTIIEGENLTIICFEKNLTDIRLKAGEFLENVEQVTVRIPLNEAVARFFKLHGDSILAGLRLSSSRVTIQLEEDAIVITGPQSLTASCHESISQEIQGLTIDSMSFGRPETSGCITGETANMVILGIEQARKCAIVVNTIEETADLCTPFTLSSEPDKALGETLQCKYVFPNGKIIEVYCGDILDHPADYLVNSANDELKHSRGLAKAIVDRGGESIQKECLDYMRDKVKLIPSDVVITDSGNLLCKKVLHVVVPKWGRRAHEETMNSQETKEGRYLRHGCLTLLDKAKDGKTIAIPCLGTGIYSVPYTISARNMLAAAHEFMTANSGCLLREVHFVDNNQEAVDALIQEMIQKYESDANFEIRHCVLQRWGHTPISMVSPATRPVSTAVATTDSFQTKEGMEIGLIIGNIAQCQANVIVSTVHKDLDLTKNPCSKALLDVAGKELSDHCKKWLQDNNNKPLDEGQFAETDGGKLKCEKVFHLRCHQWKAQDGEQTLRQLINNLLSEARKRKFKSIAIPALGTGSLGYPLDIVAKVLFDESKKFSTASGTHSCLKHVDFVVYEKNNAAVKKFQEEFQNCSGKHVHDRVGRTEPRKKTKKSERKKTREVVTENVVYEDVTLDMEGLQVSIIQGNMVDESTNAIAFLDRNRVQKRVSVEIVVENANHLNEIKEDFLRIEQERSSSKVIEHESIIELAPNEILELQNHHGVLIEMRQEMGYLRITGLSENVANAATAVYQIIVSYEKVKHSAALTNQQVQWLFYETKDESISHIIPVKYEDKLSAEIEKAHQSGQPSVEIGDNPKYRIDFQTMVETDLETGDTTKVFRRSCEGFPLPEAWELQPIVRETGKELEVYLAPVDPIVDASQYDESFNMFKRTMPNATIDSIKRIQNPRLYQIYKGHQKKMNERGSCNEQRLFHGTTKETMENVNKTGFNRAYCGKNAVRFGKGVYFARKASYSARKIYAVPDSEGKQYMYVGRVLVGKYTKGKNFLIVPPAIDPNNPTAGSYDSVVDDVNNPGIFVVFYDYQCYPEYLITFKDNST